MNDNFLIILNQCEKNGSIGNLSIQLRNLKKSTFETNVDHVFSDLYTFAVGNWSCLSFDTEHDLYLNRENYFY